MLISSNKSYSKLVTFGCSYTNGYMEEEKAQWGNYLSKHLNCPHLLLSPNASSNYYISNKVINFCESQKEKDFCIGIQWSEPSRREVYVEKENDYIAFNLSTLMLTDKFQFDEFYFLKKNLITIDKMFFRMEEMIWRTINSMLFTISYLRDNDIDFIMFQGINSILDFDTDDSTTFPISRERKENILNQPEFFNEYVDMHTHMFGHHLFNQDNQGHPNSKYIQWWSSEMYNYIKGGVEKTPLI